MNTKLLKLINKDSRTDISTLATMLGMTEEEVATEIKEMEKEG